jgi:hypothetical protein
VRIHNLRHTFAYRLRAAGVSAEDREALLGHANRSMAGHYASADVGRLLKQASLVLNRQETCTGLRVANAGASALWRKGPARVPQQEKGLQLQLVSLVYLARPAGLEPTTPWFVESAPKFLNFGCFLRSRPLQTA